jgi:glutathione S-transferase
MLQVLGRPNSINVRKVLWLCTELELTVQHEPWGVPEMPLRSPEYLALNPNALVPVLRDGGLVLWESNTICRYLASRENRTDLLPNEPAPFAAGRAFTLADIVLGLATHRWFMTPMQRPALPAVEAYYERLTERPGFQQHGRNGVP